MGKFICNCNSNSHHLLLKTLTNDQNIPSIVHLKIKNGKPKNVLILVVLVDFHGRFEHLGLQQTIILIIN